MISHVLLVLSCSSFLNLSFLIYADPGSGILIWQLATAAALGLLFYARTILRKIRFLIRARVSKESNERPPSNI